MLGSYMIKASHADRLLIFVSFPLRFASFFLSLRLVLSFLYFAVLFLNASAFYFGFWEARRKWAKNKGKGTARTYQRLQTISSSIFVCIQFNRWEISPILSSFYLLHAFLPFSRPFSFSAGRHHDQTVASKTERKKTREEQREERRGSFLRVLPFSLGAPPCERAPEKRGKEHE